MRNKEKLGEWIIETLVVSLLTAASMSGCSQTYSKDRVADEITSICEKEYGIHNVQVKSAGTTLGVFLPLSRLFNADPKDLLSLSKVESLESLLQPSEEALKQVEDVLFSTSRVILSTDKKVDFYTLRATDVESTGFEIDLTGYIDDIKRVRLWDISRNDYRKRVLHNLTVNRTAVWSKPVRGLFESLGKKDMSEILASFLLDGIDQQAMPTFLEKLFAETLRKDKLSYEWLDVRSEMARRGEAFVYVKLRETYVPKTGDATPFAYPSGTVLEYIFIVRSVSPGKYVITRAIPFYYVDEGGIFQKVTFPDELGLDQNLSEWEPLFEVEELTLGNFLARQITRRVETMLGSDERIFNTFESARLEIRYEKVASGRESQFILDLDVEPKESSAGQISRDDWVEQDDIVYMLNLVVREFVTVIRTYQFNDFSNFALMNTAFPSLEKILERPDLELFRRGKLDIRGLLQLASPSF